MARSKDCPHCDRTLPSSRALEDHLRRSHPDTEDPTNWTPIIAAVLAVLAVAAVGAALLTGGGGGAETPYHIEQSPRTGDDDAPVKFIAFESPACPSCRAFHTRGSPSTFERVLDTYAATGQVTYVEKFSPIGYPWERTAANAQKCTWHLGGWEPFHDLTQTFYEEQHRISTSNVVSFAEQWAQGQPSISSSTFSSCLDDDRYRSEVSRDVADGNGAGVAGTPTFIIVSPTGSTEKIVGPQPFSTFQGAIEAALADVPEDASSEEANGSSGTNATDGDQTNETQATRRR